jgi:hypothetical protein
MRVSARHALARPLRDARVGPGEQQQLLDQRVELDDVAPDLLDARAAALAVGLLGRELEPHAHARERRAQLVRRVGQELPLLLDEQVDARGRLVEGGRQRGHLVPPLDGHAQAELAAAPALDPLGEQLEAPGDPPRDRIAGHRHDRGQRDQRGEEGLHREVAVDRARPQGRPAVGLELDHQDRARGAPAPPARPQPRRRRERVRRRRAHQFSAGVTDDHVDRQRVGERGQPHLPLGRVEIGPRLRQHGRRVPEPLRGRPGAVAEDAEGHPHRDQAEEGGGQHDQVELHVQTPRPHGAPPSPPSSSSSGRGGVKT